MSAVVAPTCTQDGGPFYGRIDSQVQCRIESGEWATISQKFAAGRSDGRDAGDVDEAAISSG